LWEDSRRALFKAMFDDEPRFGMVAQFGGKLWCAIFTPRGEKIRMISIRRARKFEKGLYQ
jgi:uncharacterized DUF497 family protein